MGLDTMKFTNLIVVSVFCLTGNFVQGSDTGIKLSKDKIERQKLGLDKKASKDNELAIRKKHCIGRREPWRVIASVRRSGRGYQGKY